MCQIALANTINVPTNYSLSFDGVNDYGDYGNSADFNVVDELTISVWIKPNEIKNASIIDRLPYSGSNGYRLNIRSDGEIWTTFGSAESNDVAKTGTNYYSIGEWIHIAGVFKNSDYVKLYINGSLMESENTTISFSTDKSLEFGRWYNTVGDNEYFNGNIDEVSFWNIPLDETQIQSVMSNELSGDEEGLIGYWNFNEGEGDITHDMSSNGNDGTIYGATWSTDVPIIYTGPVWHVSTTGNDTTGDGSANNPFATIQHGIDVASDSNTVLVYSGTYVENINYNGKNIVVKSESGPEVTIIDGNQDTSVVIFNGGETSTAVLSGFTIQNGRAGDGGGIYCYLSSPTLEDLIISGNTTSGSPWGRGGGVYCHGSNSSLENVVITNNIAGEGGGIFCLSSNPALNNVTLSGDSASSFGGGISIYNGSHPILVNSILWNNSTPEICSHGTGDPNSITVTYSDVQYGQDSIVINDNGTIYWEEGNIDADPLFVDPDNDDFHLTATSPCIDAGDPDLDGDGEDYTTDTDDQDPDGTRMDIGAYYFDQTIFIPPTVSITNLSTTNVGTDDELTVSWEAYDNLGLDSAFVDIFYSDEEVIRVDTTMAETGQSTIEVPDNTLDPFQLIITVWDYNHNEASDTSEVITVFDNTQPVVTVLSPSEGFSVPENEEMTVTWSATDNIEMDTIAVYYSDDGNQSGSLVGIVPPDSNSFTFTVPTGVTDSGMVRVKARDIYMNTGNGFSPIFTVTDNTPPTVELLNPQSGTELDIASFAELTWDATDNVGVTEVDLHYSIDNGSSWTSIVEGEENTGLYLWPVPNSPSDQVVLRLIVHDAVGLSDTSVVSGLSITIVYPTVTAIVPPPGLLMWRESQITIAFSQAMNPIDDQSIAISSGYSDSVTDSAAFSYVDTSHTLIIEFPSSFASLDTVTTTLQAIGISNIYGYPLDGNGDGQGGDNYAFQYNSSMLADYDTSDTLDLLDLAHFVQALEDDDYYYELGPVSGTAPHLISSPDSTFDIEDVMAFVMMWNWYVTTRSSLFRVWSESGCPVNIETTPDSLFIDIPEGVLAYEVQIKYNPKDILISNPSSLGDINLNNNDEEAGIYTLLTTHEELNKIALPIAINGKEADISFSFRAAGYDGEILSQFTRELNIASIPSVMSYLYCRIISRKLLHQTKWSNYEKIHSNIDRIRA